MREAYLDNSATTRCFPEVVELMNKKSEDMGLHHTHFMNASGLHHDEHYSTCREMAEILRYAMENEIMREVLTTYQYTTSATPEHPEGIELTSTMFSRMYGDEPENAFIIAGKTGYTLDIQVVDLCSPLLCLLGKRSQSTNRRRRHQNGAF